jgi:hypothetical protein
MTDTASIYGDHKPATGSGNFFALEDGKTVRIRIQSAPYIYQDTFKKEGQPDKVSTRYAWLIYNHDEHKAQILKQSGTFFSSLAAIAKDVDYGDPTGYDLKVTRTGTGTETKYQIVPTPKTIELTEDMLGAVAGLDIVADSKEPSITLLEEYMRNGSKFNHSGDVVLTDLPEGNPLDAL